MNLVCLFVLVFQSHQKSQLHEILVQGVILGQLKNMTKPDNTGQYGDPLKNQNFEKRFSACSSKNQKIGLGPNFQEYRSL